MKLALITPVPLLRELVPKYSDRFHMVIAPTVLKSKEYAEYYRHLAEQGDEIMLDNGAYEFGQPITDMEIVEAARRVGATTVVAPDWPKQRWSRTFDDYLRFRDVLPEVFAITAIPQSEVGDIAGWTRNLVLMLDDHERLSHLGMSILACPVAFCNATGTSDVELNRLAAMAHVQTEICSKEDLNEASIRVHFFGAGDRVDVLPCYRKFGDSIDTKGPIKAGLLGNLIEGGYMYRGSVGKMSLTELPKVVGAADIGAIHENIRRFKEYLA